MSANRRNFLVPAAGALIAVAAMALPASMGVAAETVEAPLLPYELAVDAVAPVADVPVEADAPAPAVDRASLECMSKVIHHESRGQPRRGQLAVAQAMMNRLEAGRFGDSICAVANQRGQFFNTASYQPNRDSADWAEAVDVAREALAGDTQPVAPGAMFFRASFAPANGFFRTRQRVAAVGGHIFYR